MQQDERMMMMMMLMMMMMSMMKHGKRKVWIFTGQSSFNLFIFSFFFSEPVVST
jgi:hypothetical protein